MSIEIEGLDGLEAEAAAAAEERDAAVAAASAPEPEPEPEADPDVALSDNPVDSTSDPEELASEPEAEANQEPWYKKRIDSLTGKREEERRAREAAEARARSLEALLVAHNIPIQGQPQVDDPAPAAQPQQPAFTREDVVKEAQRIAAADAFNRRCNDVFNDGVKAHGAKFQQAVQTLNAAGVMNDPTFVEAALETESPADILNHLGQHPDEAMRIAEMPPIKRAVEMDRLARTLKAPKPAPVSKAPPPIAPVGGATRREAIDLADEGETDDDFFAEFDKQLRARAR